MKRISAAGHIDPSHVDPDALKVIRRLRSLGFEAFVVGGSVRDLWLGYTPKDFDVATDASPRQVKKAFSNCRLIGRRFRLAHVFFGPKIIEVSTFRSSAIANQPDDTVGDEGEERDLLIRDDNVFGTAEEDAVRRDFTMNGLFYDPAAHEVIDYVDGTPDLESRLVRTIGDPYIRMQEDPVRILRAIKFAARLGMSIHADAWDAMLRYRQELLRCSSARVHEEIIRLLNGGFAHDSVKLMWKSGVLEVLLPDLTHYLGRAGATEEDDQLWRILDALDKVDRTQRPISPGLLVGVAFWPVLAERMELPEYATLDYGLRIERVVESVTRNLRLPKREGALLKQVLIARRRLRPTPGQKGRRGTIQRMVSKSYFPTAIAFCEIEMRSEGKTVEQIRTWEEDLGMPALAAKSPAAPRKKRRRRRRRGKPDGVVEQSQGI